MDNFMCRVCGHDQFIRARSYHGCNYRCLGCGVIFTNPDQFSAPPVKIKFLHDRSKMPLRMTPDSTCYDLHALDDVVLQPGVVTPVKTGIAIELPKHFEAQVRGRSGFSRRGILLADGIGSIDADYRGDIGVQFFNVTSEPFYISSGERIAQMAIAQAIHYQFKKVDELSETCRGAGGFGHTGV